MPSRTALGDHNIFVFQAHGGTLTTDPESYMLVDPSSDSQGDDRHKRATVVIDIHWLLACVQARRIIPDHAFLEPPPKIRDAPVPFNREWKREEYRWVMKKRQYLLHIKHVPADKIGVHLQALVSHVTS